MEGLPNIPNWAVPGQLVVCIAEGRWNEISGRPNVPQVWPHRGFHYTIAEVAIGERSVYLTLIELGLSFEYDIRGFEPLSGDEVEARMFRTRKAPSSSAPELMR